MPLKRRVSRFFPIRGWLSDFSPRNDIIAGITLAGLLVPQGMAYAGIAGVRPEMGLYAASAGLLIYAIFGTSRQLAVTATSSSAAMLAALLAPLASNGSARYFGLASAVAVVAGVILLAAGFLRLGSVSEFISRPVLKGFVFGLALTIMVKQAHKFMGISSGNGNFFHQVWHVLKSLGEVNLWTLSVASTALAVMFALDVVAPRVPSALVVLVLGTLAVPLLDLRERGVEVLGAIQTKIPSLRWPRIGEDELADIFVGALGIVLVLTAESLVAARTFAARHKYEINPNQELGALGAANVASGLVGGIIVGGGMSGTAANDAAGARTQGSAVTACLCVVLTLAFLLRLIRNLPEAVLAAIVVRAVAHLADIRTLKYYARVGTGSIWVALIAVVAVLQMGILKGLLLSVCLTLILLMSKLSKPQDSVLGRLKDSRDFVDVARHTDAKQIPRLLVFRPNGIVFFANANRIRNRLRELIKQADPPVTTVIVNLEASPEIDVSGLEMLREFKGELQDLGIVLWFARVADPVRDLFTRSGFVERFGQRSIFRSTAAAVDAFLETRQSSLQDLSA